MRPLQITAMLASPIGLGRPEDIALDGILSYEVLRRHFGADFYTLPNPKEYLYFARLPLAMCGTPSPEVQTLHTGDVWMDQAVRRVDTSLWYWSCSSTQVVIPARDTLYWNKQFAESMTDFIDFQGRRGKIITEQGRMKACHSPLHRIITKSLTWYAYGDSESVAMLLAPVVTLAKKRAYGNGHVIKWEVEEIAEDASTWKDNTLMHPLPGPLAQGIAWQEPPTIQHIAFRAPQWHPMNQAMCMVGGKRHA